MTGFALFADWQVAATKVKHADLILPALEARVNQSFLHLLRSLHHHLHFLLSPPFLVFFPFLKLILNLFVS